MSDDILLVEMLWRFVNSCEEGQRLAEQLAETKAEVMHLLSNSVEFEDRLLAACAIVKLDPALAKRVLPVLIEGLKSADKSHRVLSALTCERLGPSASPAVPALIELVANKMDQDDLARHRAIRALGAIGASAASAVPALLESLFGIGKQATNERKLEAVNVAMALSFIRPDGQEAIAALKDCLNLDGIDCDFVRWLRLTAAEAIWLISSDHESALSIATAMLGDEEWWLRCHACDLLGALGPAGRPAAPNLRRLHDDNEARVQCAAGTALAQIDQP
jgi:HEAT repeat protein